MENRFIFSKHVKKENHKIEDLFFKGKFNKD